MDKDEALDLALEIMHNQGDVGVDEWRAAEAAIKQARSTPVQEPVAEIHSSTLRWIALEDHRPSNALLYTTPPKRKPLTDEEIQQIFIANSVVVDNGNAYMVAGLRTVNIARAIEAAHGIK